MGRRRGRGPGGITTPCTARVFPSRLSPLRSSRCFDECYAQSAWPESHPVSAQKRSDNDIGGHLRLRFGPLRSSHGPPSVTRPSVVSPVAGSRRSGRRESSARSRPAHGPPVSRARSARLSLVDRSPVAPGQSVGRDGPPVCAHAGYRARRPGCRSACPPVRPPPRRRTPQIEMAPAGPEGIARPTEHYREGRAAPGRRTPRTPTGRGTPRSAVSARVAPAPRAPPRDGRSRVAAWPPRPPRRRLRRVRRRSGRGAPGTSRSAGRNP